MNNKKKPTKEEMPFETALKQLEKIVHDLEAEDLSLDTSMKLFEEGMGLYGYCAKQLKEAELRVKKVMDKDSPDNKNDDFQLDKTE